MTVLRVGMMSGVMAGRLDQSDVLKEGNDRTIFGGRAVGPLVNLICVGAEDREEPDLPGEQATKPGYEHHYGREAHQVP